MCSCRLVQNTQMAKSIIWLHDVQFAEGNVMSQTAKQFSFCRSEFTADVTPDDSCSNESLVMLRINRHMTLCVMHNDVIVCSDFSFKTQSHNHSYLWIMKR